MLVSPVQRRSYTSEHVWSPELGHFTHIHETSACCGSVDLGGDIVLECVPPHCLPSQKLSQHPIRTPKPSPSTWCFCATTLCKPRKLNVPGSCCSDALKKKKNIKKTAMVSSHGFPLTCHCDSFGAELETCYCHSLDQRSR